MKKAASILSVMILLFTMQGYAQTNSLGQDINAITTAVPFLSIAPDSRAGAMGDIGCATSSDGNSQSYNPAKYAFNKNKFGFSISYSPWLRNLVNDINLAYLTGYWRITDMDAIAMSLRYFSLGNIEFMDPNGEWISTQKPNEFAIDFTYSRKLIDQLSIAITPRFIYSNLTAGQFVGGEETKAGLAGAADISLFYEQDFKVKKMNNSTLRAGLCISNIGNKMSYSSGTLRRDFLPTNLKLGIGYEMDFDGYNKLTVNGEINKLLVPTNPIYQTDSMGHIVYNEAGDPVIAYGMNPDVSVPQGMIQSFYDAPGGFREELREVMFAVGAEYSYRDLFFFRLGFFHESQYKGNREFVSIGAGLKYTVFGFDVSYLIATRQYHPLANTLRFTLNLDFVSTNKNEIKQQNRFN
ncbi:MAG: type IX secretion system outer membrane channel protein PorV [Bacteroidales bacterium]|nr:type IX secretion system outer membrane channel protein PorV [Bacteroidales bacterium]